MAATVVVGDAAAKLENDAPPSVSREDEGPPSHQDSSEEKMRETGSFFEEEEESKQQQERVEEKQQQQPSGFVPTTLGSSELTILTYNVMAPCNVVLGPTLRESDYPRSWALRNRKVVAVLEYTRPEIICLQEYWLDAQCHAIYYNALFNDYRFCLSSPLIREDESFALDADPVGTEKAGDDGREDGLATLVSVKGDVTVADEVTFGGSEDGFAAQLVLLHRSVKTGEVLDGGHHVDEAGEGEGDDGGGGGGGTCSAGATAGAAPELEPVRYPFCVVNTVLIDRFDGSDGGARTGGRTGRSNAAVCSKLGRQRRELGIAQVQALLRGIGRYLEKTGLLQVPVFVAGAFNGCMDTVYAEMKGAGYRSCFAFANGREVEVTHRTAMGEHVAADFVWQQRRVLRCQEDAEMVKNEIAMIREIRERTDKRMQWEDLISKGSKGAGGKKTVAQRRAAAERKRGMLRRKQMEMEAVQESRRLFNEANGTHSHYVMQVTAERAYALPEHCTDMENLLRPCLHHPDTPVPEADFEACCSPDDLSEWSDVSDHRPVVVVLRFDTASRDLAAAEIQKIVRGRQQLAAFAKAIAKERNRKALLAYKKSMLR